MNYNQLIRLIALAAVLSAAGCTTVVEKEPSVHSTTTTTEETAVHPMHGSSSTQTTVTQSR